jgi:hypothetical protein
MLVVVHVAGRGRQWPGRQMASAEPASQASHLSAQPVAAHLYRCAQHACVATLASPCPRHLFSGADSDLEALRASNAASVQAGNRPAQMAGVGAGAGAR